MPNVVTKFSDYEVRVLEGADGPVVQPIVTESPRLAEKLAETISHHMIDEGITGTVYLNGRDAHGNGSVIKKRVGATCPDEGSF